MPSVTRSADDRLWSKVDKNGPVHPTLGTSCWLWTGGKNSSGYGAHRRVYEAAVGPIPDGLELDHLCRQRCCVNPAHLEPVTPAVNSQRAMTPERVERLAAVNARAAAERAATHCPAGHPYDEANTYRYRGSRYCRACSKAATSKWKATRSKRAQGIPYASRAGEAAGGAKLTWAKVAEIRRRAGGETQRALAHAFGVAESVVSLIVRDKAWRLADAPPAAGGCR